MKYNIYCDGGCKGNPGPGGYGVVELDENNTLTAAFRESFDYDVTNNIMELKAFYKALQLASTHKPNKVEIFIDSAYAMNSILSWAKNWSQNGWINSKKEPVANKELIEEIYNYYIKNFSSSQYLAVTKVKGHVGIIGNELVDALSKNNGSLFKKLILGNKLVINYNECKKNLAIFSS